MRLHPEVEVGGAVKNERKLELFHAFVHRTPHMSAKKFSPHDLNANRGLTPARHLTQFAHDFSRAAFSGQGELGQR
jgi:hypothetical protein